MCMTQTKKVEIAECPAFKLFTRCKEGKLRSAFGQSHKSGLFYPSNERIRVDDDDATFFAFEIKKQAMGFACGARKTWYADSGMGSYGWNIVEGLIIVLPVTMFEVVQIGKFHVPSGDVQCMDGYYPACESKEIIVHDNVDTRNDFHDEVLARFFRNTYSMSAIEKEAIRSRLPQVAEHIK